MPSRATIHRATPPRRKVEDRPTSQERGYTGRWKKARIIFLAANPLCAQCAKNGRIIEAVAVDHVIPHKGDYALFWDESNWSPLCEHCHNSKSAKEGWSDRRATGGG